MLSFAKIHHFHEKTKSSRQKNSYNDPQLYSNHYFSQKKLYLCTQKTATHTQRIEIQTDNTQTTIIHNINLKKKETNMKKLFTLFAIMQMAVTSAFADITLIADKTSCNIGETVTLTATCPEGYASYLLMDDNDELAEYENVSDINYKFTPTKGGTCSFQILGGERVEEYFCVDKQSNFVTITVADTTPTGIGEIQNSKSKIQNSGKYIQNGRMVIVRNGQKYNAAGQEVK